MPSQLPAKALSANVPQFERILTGTPMFVYPPDALPFQIGKIYAWQIQAIDANGQAATANQGKSEIRTFTYKGLILHGNFTTIFIATPIHVKGTLQYDWPGSSRPPKPLPNVPVSLILEYVFHPQVGLPIVLQKSQVSASITDLGKEISTTTTDGSGAFSFSFNTTDSMSCIAKDTSIQIPNKGLLKGDLYRAGRVVVNSPYYRSPDTDVLYKKGSDLDVGTITGKARRWDLIAQIWDPTQAGGWASKGTLVYLYQKTMPADIPKDIGDVTSDPRPTWGSWTLVSKDSVQNGQVHFSCLVENKKPNDDYSIYIQTPGMQQLVQYDNVSVNYNGQPNSTLNISSTDNSTFADEWGFTTGQIDINPKYVLNNITGYLTYKYPEGGPAKQLAGIHTRLVLKYILHIGGGGVVDVSDYVNEPDANTTLAYCTSDSTGKVIYQISLSPVSLDSMGVMGDWVTMKIGMGEFPKTYHGIIHRVARIIIDSPYYTSPGQSNPDYSDITIQSVHAQNFGTFSCLVRAYKYKIFAKDKYTQNPLDNIEVYVLRAPGTKPPEVPTDEGGYTGTPKTLEYGYVNNWVIVAKGITTIDPNTNQHGVFTFTNLVKNADLNSSDKYYVLVQSDPKSLSNYQHQFGIIKYDCNNEQTTFEDDYPYSSCILTQTDNLEPLPPYVQATYVRSDSKYPPIGGMVTLNGAVGPLAICLGQSTIDSSGIVKFDNLPPNPNGPDRYLSLSASSLGLRDTTLSVLRLDKGQKEVFDQIVVYPRASISGLVVDDAGYPVNAYVGIENDNMYPTKCVLYKLKGLCEKYRFDVPAPTGIHKVIIEPIDASKYLTTDTLIFITQPGQDVGTLIAYRKMHRIKFMVTSIPPGAGPPAPLKNASVEFLNMQTPVSGATDSQGNVSLLFNSDATNFKIKIKGPDDKDHEEQIITLVDSCSKQWHTVYVGLKQAGRITGKVFVGKDKQIVAGAHVFLQYTSSSDLDQIEAVSDSTGSYVVRNVPFGTHTFYAVKGGTIGDSALMSLQPSGMTLISQPTGSQNGKIFVKTFMLPITSLDFNLRVYNDMDITKLLGVPIEIMTLTQLGSNKAVISGRFVYLPSNKQFQIDTSIVLYFDKVNIIPGNTKNSANVPFAVPDIGYIPVNVRTLEIKSILQTYLGAVNANGTDVLQIQDYSKKGLGIIKGKVAIAANSFATGGAISFQNDSLWIVLPSGSNINERINIPVVAVDSTDLASIPNGFSVVDEFGNSLKYTLHTFDSSAIADSSTSFARQGSLHLATRLQTNIPNITPSNLNLDIGDVVVTPTNVEDISSTQTLTIQLEQWQIVSSSWEFGSSGLVLHNGTIKTPLVDVPFTNNLPITPTSIETDKASYNLSGITLGGVIPLDIFGSVQFLYDPNAGTGGTKGHWSLRIIPQSGVQDCARISTLPGMKQGDGININSMYVLSNGETGFSTDPSANPITLYNVTSFTPAKIVVFPNRVNIPGALDVHIPLVSAQTTSIDYYKDANNNIAFSFDPIKATFAAKGGTDFDCW